MKYLFLFLLTGCTLPTPILQIPIWHGDLSQDLCEPGEHSYTFEGEKKTFIVYRVGQDELYDHCGDAMACTLARERIYLPDDTCQSLAHEMNHVWANDWVDRPKTLPRPGEP